MGLRNFALFIAISLITIVVSVSVSTLYIINSQASASSVIHQTAQSIYISQELRLEIIKLDLDPLDESNRKERLQSLEELAKQAGQHVTSEPERNLVDQLSDEILEISLLIERGETPDWTIARRIAHSLLAVNRDQAEQLRQQIQREFRLGTVLAVIAISAVLGLCLVILIAVRRFLFVPLVQLKKALDDFTQSRPMGLNNTYSIREVQFLSDSLSTLISTIRNNQRRQLEFVASVAHDIRNPLQALELSIRLLARNPSDSTDIARLCGQQIQYLGTLLADLIDRSRIQAGSLQLRLEEYDVNRLVRDVFDLHRASSGRHRFLLDASSDALVVQCDRHRLRQVLHNLVSNAVKYSPEGGDIRVSTGKTSHFATISVSDSGLGIRHEELEQVFQPYQRGTLTEGIEGIGLGLYVSKKIIEQHNGRIEVASEVGKGSQFCIEIPLVEPARGTATPP